MATSLRDQQKEVVRLLVLQHGQKKASELSKVPYETVRKWTQRGHWLELSRNVPKQPITIAADSVAQEIQENGKQTKLSLSRASRRMALDSEQATLRHAPYVHKVAQTAALVNPELYAAEGPQQSQVAVNIAILGTRPEELQIGN